MMPKIKFLDSGREPQVAPNPQFPNGMDIVERHGLPPLRLAHPEGAKVIDGDGPTRCLYALPYPAPRCGVLVVECETCGKRIGLTVAGRPDDPRSLRMTCKKAGEG
jgi:hypothetical protein